jgi:hypothetical protein
LFPPNPLSILVTLFQSKKYQSNLIVNILIKEKEISSTQGMVRIQTKNEFFKDNLTINESLIDQHLEIYRELVSIAENYIKFLYLFKYPSKSFETINKTYFFSIWDDLKNDSELKIFVTPFPNTICFNASKHNGISKNVVDHIMEFNANEGPFSISYEEFIKMVRELYADSIVLMKIKLILILESGKKTQLVKP